MRDRLSRGFTLIELLTVIAIIAVLAAILFPVFGRVRENARQATCISNMQQISTGVGLYKDDNGGEYPPVLLGYAEDASGSPAITGVAVDAARIKHGYLYPTFVKSLDVFRCPDNGNKNTSLVVQSGYAPGSGWTGAATFGSLGFSGGSPSGFDFDANRDTAFPYYAADSYDLTSVPGQQGQFQVVYARDWTAGSGLQDKPNQLKYRNPPLDKTIIAWCNYHMTVAGANMSPVLFASGTCKPLSTVTVQQKSWTLGD